MIRRVLAWWLWKYGPDVGLLKEASRFGTKPKNAEAYDYELARQGFKRSQSHTETGRKLPVPKIHRNKTATVTPFRKVGG